MKKFKLFVSVIALVTVMLVSFGVQASGNLSVTTDVFLGICNVNASFEGCSGAPASVELIPSSVNSKELRVPGDELSDALGKVTYFNHDNCDASGNVSFAFPLKSSGEYTVRVQAMYSTGSILEKNIEFICLADAEEVWNNLISSPSDNLICLLEILGVSDELVLSMADNDNLHSVIEGYTNIGAFNKSNADAFVARIKSDCQDIVRLESVLSQIKNAENHNQIKQIISIADNARVLGISAYMERYNALKNSKLADSAVVGKDYKLVSDFINDFVEGIEAAEKAETEKSSANPSKTPASTGGGSLGGYISTPAPQSPMLSLSHPFTDISNVTWAADAITALYNEGIISGKTKTEFAPYDNITREEFVKIAIGVAAIEPSSGNLTFADVNSSSWYAPYVNAAVSAGIISGYSDTQFGVGDNITRQDVAVILDRIHTLASSGNKVDFSDRADISEYAKEAVERLSAAGVINGSDGKFMPKSNCTRAEAACMVYRMMSLIKEGK